MPRDVIIVFVVQDGQAGLIVELLKPFNGDANVELGGDGAFKHALVIVGLGLSSPIQKKILFHLLYQEPNTQNNDQNTTKCKLKAFAK